MTRNKTFYLYVHLRPDLTPFYVGKGTKKRANNFSERSGWHKNIVSKYGKENILIEMVECKNEKDAFFREKETINRFKQQGFMLCNLTDGGEGASGCIKSIETRIKLSIAQKGKRYCLGRKLTEEHKNNISKGLLGRKVSEETREKISIAQKGKPRPWQIGKKKLSDESLEKMRNRIFTPEHRKKISEAKKGEKRTPSQIENIRAARLRYLENKRNEKINSRIAEEI